MAASTGQGARGTATQPRIDVVTVCAADDRPIVRAGLLAAMEAAPDPEGYAAVELHTMERRLNHVGEAIGEAEGDATVLVIALRHEDPEPFRTIATAKALDEELQVLALVDDVRDTELREAVVAGVDGFLVTTSSGAELRRAVISIAHGERIISPEVAVHLVDSWRPDGQSQQAAVTNRERQVLELLAEGMTNREIGDQLEVSPRTVKTHVQNLLAKLDVPDRTGAVARAFRLGIIR